MRYTILLAYLLASPAIACPSKPIDLSKSELFEELETAKGFSAAQKAASELWQVWIKAPDTQSQEWLDEGMSRIRQSDLTRAKQILMGLVDYCPDYAEGYNQLAFAQFLAEELDASEANLRKTLELEPKHFGALGGMGLIAQKRGNLPLAKIWIRRAVAVHPYLKERFILDIPDEVDDL